MTDTTTTAPPATAAPDGATTAPDDTETASPSAEAAAQRVALREAEAARDTLAAQLTDARRYRIENLLSTGTDLTVTLQRPADLWEALEATPDQFFAEDGALDTEALTAYITTATEGREYLTSAQAVEPDVAPTDPILDSLARQHRPATPPSTTWQDVLRG